MENPVFQRSSNDPNLQAENEIEDTGKNKLYPCRKHRFVHLYSKTN